MTLSPPFIHRDTTELKQLQLELQRLIDFRLSGGRGSDLEDLRQRQQIIAGELRLRAQAGRPV